MGGCGWIPYPETTILLIPKTETYIVCEVWNGAAQIHLRYLETLKNAALHYDLQCTKITPISAIQIELNIQTLFLEVVQRTWLKYLENTA